MVICFFIATLIALIGILSAVGQKGKKNRFFLNPLNRLFYSVFAASTVLFLPIFNKVFEGDSFRFFKTLLLSIHTTIRLFVVDGEFSLITDYVSSADGWIYSAYTILGAFLFVVAPALTFGALLSIFKNVSSYKRLLFSYYRDIYVFSELNEKPIILAKDLIKNDPRRRIVFTDVFDQGDEVAYELSEKASAIGAICFKKDIRSIAYRIHRKRSLSFFIMGDDKVENYEQTLSLTRRFKTFDNAHLYLFSSEKEGEMLLQALNKGQMKIRRINETQAIIDRLLYDQGVSFFESARDRNGGVKLIHVVIVGLGAVGKAFLKSIAWFCQMDGYELKIDAIDPNLLAYEEFRAECPELAENIKNRVTGLPEYDITIHAGIHTDTGIFSDTILALKDTTYVLTDLGCDEDNIEIGLKLRMLFERNQARPVIKVLMRNTAIKEILSDLRNHRGAPYHLDFIGDHASSYSEKTIIDTELEEVALKLHKEWGEEDSFWHYEYNYRSSIASALHKKVRVLCGIPGAGKKEGDLSPQEADSLGKLEHRRWNAYMRSQGFIYTGSDDPDSRNDLGKMHHLIVDHSELSAKEKQKDVAIGSQ